MIINFERKPVLSLYYLGGIVLEILIEKNNEQIESLFALTKESIAQDLYVDFFYYTLDWLFLLSLIKLENGRVSLCV